MARAPGLGPGYREFESHHSDIFFCPATNYKKLSENQKNFSKKLKQNEHFLCYLGMKWLKIVLLTVLLISCRNAEKAQDHQAFIAAKDLYLQGDSQGALEKLEALEKHKPSYFPSFILDGRISLFTGQYERAEEKLTHVLKINPLEFDAIRWMANLYLLTKRYEETEKLVTIALEKYPEEPRLLLLLAASYKGQGKVKEAVVTYHRAYLFEVELAYAHYEMAQLYSQFGLEKEHKEQMERASALFERRLHE